MFVFQAPQHTKNLSKLEINGKGICLRSISHTYEQAIYSGLQGDVSKYLILKTASSLYATKAFIKGSIQSIKEGRNLDLVILEQESFEFLGCCGIDARSDSRNPEFSIWLKKEAQGQGFAKNATRLLASWAYKTLEIDSFICPVAKDNLPSLVIPESLGGSIIEEVTQTDSQGKVLQGIIYQIPLPLLS